MSAALRSGRELADWFGRTVSLYGLVRAIAIFAALYNPARRRGTLIALKLRDYKAPVFLRAGTSDVPTFFQTLIGRQYGFHPFAQGEAVARRYASLVALGIRPLIIDCGANIGLSALWFANTFPEAVVYAVEPDTGNFAMLERNAAPYEGVKPVRAGVWNEEAALAIADPDVAPWEFQVREVAPSGADGAGGGTVPSVTIDGIRRIEGAHGIFIAKIDIEGAEQYLFRSNTDWVAASDVLIIELHDWMIPGEGSSNGFFRCLARLPIFDLVTRDENVFVFQSAAAPARPREADPAGGMEAMPLLAGRRADTGHRDYRRAAKR